mmetsp:Transcript_1414/g.5377  ORF Transcript_1414/g.5377 Transcript_1414/m.5377 type:complete len:320 (-) Transcript_1414:199-1158(-)
MLYNRTSLAPTKETNSNATATASRLAHCRRKFLCETFWPKLSIPEPRNNRSNSSALCNRPLSTRVSYRRMWLCASANGIFFAERFCFCPSPPARPRSVFSPFQSSDSSKTGIKGSDSKSFARGHPCFTPSMCAGSSGGWLSRRPRVCVGTNFPFFLRAGRDPEKESEEKPPAPAARSRNSSTVCTPLGLLTALATTDGARGCGRCVSWSWNSSSWPEVPGTGPVAKMRRTARPPSVRLGGLETPPVSRPSRRTFLRPASNPNPIQAGLCLASDDDAPALVRDRATEGATCAATRADIPQAVTKPRLPANEPRVLPKTTR